MDSHAGMFLAFDPAGDGTFAGAGAGGTVWSIEGNVGDRVQVKHRSGTDTVINGFGKVTEAMFLP
jgi:glutamate synthase domain-containing protein 3